MCIRDRISTPIVEIGVLIWPVGLLREEAVDFLSGEGSYALDGDYEEGVCQVFRAPLPVSYTHLDVYKRQVL